MKRKLMLLLVLISAFPLLIASLVSYRLFNSNMQDDYKRLSFTQVRALQSEVQVLVDKHLEVIKLIARNPAVRSFDVTGATNILQQASETYPILLPISLENNKGQQVTKSNNSKLTDVSNREFFKQAMQGKEEVVSEVMISFSNNHPIFNLATPVRTDDGSIIGVLHGSVELTILSDFVTEHSQEGDIAFIVDRDGKILAHPDSKLVAEHKDVSQLAFVRKGLNGENGSIDITDEQGNKKLVNFLQDPKTGWVICYEKSYSDYNEKNMRLLWTNGLVLLITILIVALIGYYFSNQAVRPLLQLLTVTNAVKKGNLTTEVDIQAKDEVGTLASNFNAMVVNLRGLITQVSASASRVVTASDEMATSADQSTQAANQVAIAITKVAQETDQQSKIVSEATGAIGRMSTDIRDMVANASEVAEIAKQSTDAALDGGKAIENAIEQMTNIEKSVIHSAEVVGALGLRSREIGQIIDTISSLAGQTNLLALNAAIEAARAGEQGRSFAVVAEEVRKLAEQSHSSAKQISELIKAIQDDTKTAVETMKSGTDEVKTGTEVVNIAGKSFEDITSLIQTVSERVEQIYLVLQKVAGSGQELIGVIRRIDEMSKEIAGQTQTVSAATEEESAAMQQIAASSEELAKLASALQIAIRKFII